MSTDVKRVKDLIKMATDLNWKVERGAHFVKIFAPGTPRPIALPGTPGSSRNVLNIEKTLERCGLHNAHAELLRTREEERRAKVTTARKRASDKIAKAEQAIQDEVSKPSITALIANGSRIGPETITPEIAQQLLDAARAAQDAQTFKQRPINWTIVEEYALEMLHGGWMEYLPDGIIAIDTDGVPINGQKRLHAIVKANVAVGFLVARDVPREMFAYFDMAQRRSASDTFAIAGLPAGAEAQSMIRLAMAYEEMLRGILDRTSWVSWNKRRQTNVDMLRFYEKRPHLAETLFTGRAMRYGAAIVPAAAAVFEFYADKAWPQRPKDRRGYDPLDAYVSGIRDGANIATVDPAMLVRNWSMGNAVRRQTIQSKRETHLFVLLKYWEIHALGKEARGNNPSYNKTWPMPLPFHPDGEDVAVRNAIS